MPICLCMVSGSSSTTAAEVNSCNSYHVACKAQSICYLALYKKSLLTPGLPGWSLQKD